MKISTLLGVDISAWEEKVLSAALLQRSDIPKAVFAPKVEERMTQACLRMSRLPGAWIKEICIQILTNAS